jgi:hypothetical protein
MADSVESTAKVIANNVIENDLVRQPRSAEDLQSLIMQLLQDSHVKDNHKEITDLATNIISNDPRIVCESKGKDEDWAIWVYHKAR